MKMNRGRFIKRGIVLFAVLVVAVLIVIFISNKIFVLKLSDVSKNAKVTYIKFLIPTFQSSQSLMAGYTAKEFFEKYAEIVVEGTVTKIDNIEVDLNGLKVKNAIMRVSVEDVIHGDVEVTHSITVLIPDAVGSTIQKEDQGVLSDLKTNVRGIFILKKHGKDSYIQKDQAQIYLPDLAQYGLTEGNRDMFLETDAGLVFDRYTYSPLISAKSLGDVKKYIKNELLNADDQ